MTPLLTILIPTFKNTQACLGAVVSLLKYTEFPYKIIIVNNDADSGAREYYDKAIKNTDFHDLYVLHMASNKGWMGAINAGMRQVDTPLVCMMNDDVLFPPNSKEFWRALARHMGGQVAAVGPSTNFVMGRQSIFDLSVPSALEVKFLIGFCMMLRTDLFRQVGLLDETLPGGDDIDLSIRLRKAGYTLVAEKEAYVHHIGSQTGSKVFGQYWNSERQTDLTNNCLIRKHGVKLWFDAINIEPFRREDLSKEVQVALLEEDVWWEKELAGVGKGMNVGSGDQKLPGVWGLDRSRPGERAAGGRKFTDAAPDVTGGAEELPVQDESLDFVAARHLFEHLIDPVGALREWSRVLKPEGKVLISCPDQSRSHTMLIDYTHVHAYTPESLKNLLETTGWRVEDTQSFAVGSFGVRARKNGVAA